MDKTQRPSLDLANLNEILFVDDLAFVFRISENQARANLSAGKYGPWFPAGKRMAILRSEMLEHFRSRSCIPTDDTSPTPSGKKLLDQLKNRKTERRPR